MFSQFFPVQRGMKAQYKCKDCGNRFFAIIPLLAFLRPPKCPECGSQNTVLDDMAAY